MICKVRGGDLASRAIIGETGAPPGTRNTILQTPSRASYNEIGFRLISPFGLRAENVPMQACAGWALLAYSRACLPWLRSLQENGLILSAQFSPRSTD